jgi:hypothetical protein
VERGRAQHGTLARANALAVRCRAELFVVASGKQVFTRRVDEPPRLHRDSRGVRNAGIILTIFGILSTFTYQLSANVLSPRFVGDEETILVAASVTTDFVARFIDNSEHPRVVGHGGWLWCRHDEHLRVAIAIVVIGARDTRVVIHVLSSFAWRRIMTVAFVAFWAFRALAVFVDELFDVTRHLRVAIATMTLWADGADIMQDVM